MSSIYRVSSLTEFENDIRQVLRVSEPDEDFLLNLRKEILGGVMKPPVHQGFHLKRGWAFSLAILAVLLGVILATGPSKVWAAVRSLFGFIPGAGFVQLDAPLRILDAPQSIEREGITLTVEQIIADSQRTVLTYTVDGLTPEDFPAGEDAPFCSDIPYLQLPDGKHLAVMSGEGTGWPGGFRTAAYLSRSSDGNEHHGICGALVSREPDPDLRPKIGSSPCSWLLPRQILRCYLS